MLLLILTDSLNENSICIYCFKPPMSVALNLLTPCTIRTNGALKEHWRGSMKRKLDSYLASGLLENIPDLQDDVSFSQSNQSDIPKYCKAESDRNKFSSHLSTNPKLKQEPAEPDENANTAARKSSDLFHAKAPDTHSAKISEMTMAKSQQCAGTRKKLAFLSTPVELKV